MYHFVVYRKPLLFEQESLVTRWPSPFGLNDKDSGALAPQVSGAPKLRRKEAQVVGGFTPCPVTMTDRHNHQSGAPTEYQITVVSNHCFMFFENLGAAPDWLLSIAGRRCPSATEPSAIPVARWGWTRTTVHGRVRPSGPKSDGYLQRGCQAGVPPLSRRDPRVVFPPFKTTYITTQI
jgi:hypothetical protein